MAEQQSKADYIKGHNSDGNSSKPMLNENKPTEKSNVHKSNTGCLCGPLLRYTYINHTEAVWHGSLLLVVNGEGESSAPKLTLSTGEDNTTPVSLVSERGHTFWRYPLEATLEEREKKIEYTLSGGALNEEVKRSWWVPGRDESMRIQFYSCNGWDTDANPDDFAGPTLWKDVMRIHSQRPFHVQIGGGDQVYSDDVRTEGGPLKEWGDALKPKARAAMPCSPELESKIDEWYFNNYCQWLSREEIAEAMACIPALNIWDDHDIIDGYGSYKDRFMRSPTFLAIGRVAWKYYTLFQLQTPPKGEEKEDPSWELGKRPGPYIKERSRSICTTLGKRIVFYGLDCRTERTMKRICYSDTYDAMFERLDAEVGKATDTTHLILLLGVPIAYPRLVWAETLLSRRMITPLRLLNRKLGLVNGLFNNFDGSAELLDDLNDHWCAGPHKRERNAFIQRLQDFAQRKKVRVTILGGDVHLAAVGRFFTKAKLNVPQNKDPRYMLNVISSAITNAGPPMAVANVLNQRNKLHRLDATTSENMMDIFFENPDGSKNLINHTTMPRRNYVIITEHAGLADEGAARAPAPEHAGNGDASNNANGHPNGHADPSASEGSGKPRQGESADAAKGDAPPGNHETDVSTNALVGEGKLAGKDAEAQAKAQEEENPQEDMPPAKYAKGGAGNASAAAPVTGTKRKYALDISFRVEIDQKDESGATRAYGFVVPALEL